LKQRKDLEKLRLRGNLQGNLREAHAFDVSETLTLVNSCASSNLLLARGPIYFYENIRDFVVVEVVGEEPESKIVACGSLHVLWKDIAEIRALAVHPRFRRQGLGSKIVRYLIEEARQMGIEKVLALTLEVEFFKKLGFKPKTKKELPLKVWSECIQCPKYFQCDETGLVFDIHI
jgi:amino-acid N-acetyltransferase